MILSQTFETCYSKLTGLQFTLSNGLAFFKREVTSANLSSSINVAFLIELTIYNISKYWYVSTESIRTFTEIQQLMAVFFLFKDFMTFFTSTDDTSFK